MPSESSPTARALLALEEISARPGISAERLGSLLGVTERAARRYVAILREAGVPVVSERGPYGGYRVGRGLRLPPLMFTAAEALGLAMAVLEAHGTTQGDDPVGTAVRKLVRVLPEPVARPFEALGRVSGRRTDPDPPDPATTATLVEASAGGHRVRIGYRSRELREIEVDPWAVVVRHGRWYLLGWSHHASARRIYRIDRVASVAPLPQTFEPLPDLDPLRDLEDQLSQGWPHACEVLVEAPIERAQWCLPAALGRLEAVDEDRTLLRGTTEALEWYVGQLAAAEVGFRVLGGPELRAACRGLAARLAAAAD